jgi:DNA-binding MarR family transcriptional regulator
MLDQPAVSTEIDELKLLGGLLQLVRTLDQQVRAEGGDDGLNLAELSVLSQVSRGSDAPTLIARALRIDPARITHLTDRLVTLGYLERTVDPADRRKLRLRLTDLGAERVIKGRSDIQAAMRRLLAGLTVEELSGMNLALEGVRRVLALPTNS